MDWGKAGLSFAVAAHNLEWIRVIVSFTLWDLRIESRDIQLFAFCGGVTSETCRIQTYPI